MALRNNLPQAGANTVARGFTLLEILVVMALVAIISTSAVIYGIDNLRGSSFYSDRDSLITALQHVRSLSVGNTCLGAGCTNGRQHGVSIQADKFVVFEGASYASRDTTADQTFPASSAVSHAGATEVVFTQLSATSTGGTVTLADSVGHTTDITVGVEGQILWTK